jgi:dihydroxy-acid dehydratase
MYRSDLVKKGVEHAAHRSLLHALGVTRSEMNKPFIGIVNSYSEIIPGHMHLREIATAVKAGIYSAGGVPFEVNTIGICDGIAMGHTGMKYSLPSRELIADSVELVVQAHQFDALVFITNCDKIIPGMLMAAARINIPSIFVSGGPMLAGTYCVEDKTTRLDVTSMFEATGKVAAGQMTESEMGELEELACPGCGSCSGMYTANTMNCATEVLGMGLPGHGTIPAVDARRYRLAKEVGRQIMKLLADGILPRQIITEDSITNAFTVDMALGGSTNSVLHLMAIAHEAGINFDLAKINEISDRTPQLCSLSPAGPHHIEDLDRAGGIPGVMKELASILNPDAHTVSGIKVSEIVAQAQVRDSNVIRSKETAYSNLGGLCILFGNLAPQGGIVKRSAVAPEMKVSQVGARVFDSEELASKAIMAGEIKPGDCVVVRYEGPKGGPGMREMLGPTSMISGMGLDSKVALITDGRFSGATRGAAIGHISPEAAARGPIAALKDGDIIEIDIPHYKINVQLTDEEIHQRLATIGQFEPKIKTGYLKLYTEKVTSASTGAVFAD